MATTTSVEIHKIVRNLGVESGTESNAGDGTFNCKMGIITKIETEMGEVSWRAAGDDRGRADG